MGVGKSVMKQPIFAWQIYMLLHLKVELSGPRTCWTLCLNLQSSMETIVLFHTTPLPISISESSSPLSLFPSFWCFYVKFAFNVYKVSNYVQLIAICNLNYFSIIQLITLLENNLRELAITSFSWSSAPPARPPLAPKLKTIKRLGENWPMMDARIPSSISIFSKSDLLWNQ